MKISISEFVSQRRLVPSIVLLSSVTLAACGGGSSDSEPASAVGAETPTVTPDSSVVSPDSSVVTPEPSVALPETPVVTLDPPVVVVDPPVVVVDPPVVVVDPPVVVVDPPAVVVDPPVVVDPAVALEQPAEEAPEPSASPEPEVNPEPVQNIDSLAPGRGASSKEIADFFGLDPEVPPSENFDLLGWYLNTPEFDSKNLSRRIDEVDLADGFEDEYFWTGDDGGMVFKVTNAGARTSSGTSYVRTELREMLRRGDEDINTSSKANNWVFSSAPESDQAEAGAVNGVMKATLAIDAVTTTGDRNHIGRFIVGQIHAIDDEPLRLYYRKLPGNERGSIYAAHEVSENSDADNAGDDVYYNIIGSRSSSQENPENGFALGDIWSYAVYVSGNTLVVIVYDGALNGAEVGRAEIDMSESAYDISDERHYFKAGAYNQNNSGDDDDFAQATFYALDITHPDTVVIPEVQVAARPVDSSDAPTDSVTPATPVAPAPVTPTAPANPPVIANPEPVTGDTYTATPDSFEDVIENVSGGDEIIVTGSGEISIKNRIFATPVLIRAESIGGTTLTNATIDNSSNITLQGFVFGPNDESTLLKVVNSENIKILRNLFDHKDVRESQTSIVLTQASRFISIGYNEFRDKNLGDDNGRKITGSYIKTQFDDPVITSNLHIYRNHFSNIAPFLVDGTPAGDSDREAIAFGVADSQDVDTNNTVEYNLFENTDGENEIITVKTSRNTFRYNTFKNAMGSLSLRLGSNSEVYGNYFYGEGPGNSVEDENFQTGGIRVYGSGHNIYENYMEGLTGVRWRHPLLIDSGETSDTNGNDKHETPSNVSVFMNTIVDSASGGIQIGSDNYKNQPKNIDIRANLVISDRGLLYNNHANQSSNDWDGNLAFASGSGTAVGGGALDATEVEVLDAAPMVSKPDALTASDVGRFAP